MGWGADGAEQEQDLREFGVRFDAVSRESAIYARRLIEATLAELAAKGHTFEADGALWLRTTALGDDKDRVLKKSDPCRRRGRSEEHTSELSHQIISYAVFCLKKKKSRACLRSSVGSWPSNKRSLRRPS